MADERIIELDTINEVPADGYLAIDTVTGDTYKILPIKIGAQYTIQDGDHSFTLVGSNGYSHTVNIPYDSVSMTQAEYNALTPAEKADGTARFITDGASDVESELWSKVGRQTLDTDAQVLSNAVNELVDDIDEINSSLTNKTSTTITASSGVSLRTFHVIKQGALLLFRFSFDITTAKSNNDELFTGIDNEFIPIRSYYNTIRNANTVASIGVSNDGRVLCGNSGLAVGTYYIGEIIASNV